LSKRLDRAAVVAGSNSKTCKDQLTLQERKRLIEYIMQYTRTSGFWYTPFVGDSFLFSMTAQRDLFWQSANREIQMPYHFGGIT
jgi:hypothetical protein